MNGTLTKVRSDLGYNLHLTSKVRDLRTCSTIQYNLHNVLDLSKEYTAFQLMNTFFFLFN